VLLWAVCRVGGKGFPRLSFFDGITRPQTPSLLPSLLLTQWINEGASGVTPIPRLESDEEGCASPHQLIPPLFLPSCVDCLTGTLSDEHIAPPRPNVDVTPLRCPLHYLGALRGGDVGILSLSFALEEEWFGRWVD